MARKEEDLIDWLMAFPKYRRLKARLKIVNKDNRDKEKAIKKEWEEKAVLKEKIKQKNKLIYKLRKEIKELKS